ncbi:MAG: hypothetical protein MUC56_13635 [Thermoanaerobaculales bacterium]|jgi:hypothetical protein|nr:hypothetical protein [Thermoanaerobaculales bacterium]
MGTLECRADRDKNRLYIKLSGFFRGRDIDPAMAELDRVLAEIGTGFDVITDLTDFVPGSPAAAEALRRGGEKVKARNRRHAVRITGGLITGLMQFQRLLKGVFSEDSVRYAKSVAEAHAILDDWPGGGNG